MEALQEEVSALTVERNQHRTLPRRRQRFKDGNANRRNAKGKRQSARGSHSEPEPGKISGAGADGKGIKRIPTHAGLRQHLLQHRHKAFSLATRHFFVAPNEGGIGLNQSGGAVGGRSVYS